MFKYSLNPYQLHHIVFTHIGSIEINFSIVFDVCINEKSTIDSFAVIWIFFMNVFL